MSTPILEMAWPKEGRIVEKPEKEIDLTRQLDVAGLSLVLETGDKGMLQDKTSRLGDVKIERLRATDSFKDVAAGVIDIALVGFDKFVEGITDPDMEGDVPEVLGALDFARCHLSLMGEEAVEINGIQDLEGMRVATSYPNMLRKLLDDNSVDAKIVKRAGSVERAVARGLADAALDVVESGQTMRDNGLVDKVKLMDSSLVMIARSGLTQQQRNVATEILERLEPAQTERQVAQPVIATVTIPAQAYASYG